MRLYVYGLGERLQKISKKINRFSQWQGAQKRKKGRPWLNVWWNHDSSHVSGERSSRIRGGVQVGCYPWEVEGLAICVATCCPLYGFLHKGVRLCFCHYDTEERKTAEGDATCGVPPLGEVVPWGILCQLVFGGAGMLLRMAGGGGHIVATFVVTKE